VAVAPLCLDLARAALADYATPPNDAAIRGLLIEHLASRIRIGIEDDISDLMRDGKITKQEGGEACAATPTLDIHVTRNCLCKGYGTPMSRELRIVFDGPPSHESGRFVEVEDETGHSVNAGEWRERRDGLWELVIGGTQ
jgi:hypothetical protein